MGLFIGKQIGVFIFSYVSIKLKIAQMPNNTNWFNFYGVGVLTGIGFTMSFVCWKFSLCRKYSIYGWSKNWCINWVIIVHIIWLLFDITHT